MTASDHVLAITLRKSLHAGGHPHMRQCTALAVVAAGIARADDSLKIGFVASLSSPTSTAGTDMLDGFRLGLGEMGGKPGGRPVDLVVGDDELKPDVGVPKLRKMLDEDKVPLITGMVLSNIAVAASYQADTSADGMSIYLQRNGVKSVSIIAPNYAAGRDVLNGFKRYFTNAIATETYTPLGKFDFAAEVERDASGALVNSYRERIDEDHAGAYVGQCKMP